MRRGDPAAIQAQLRPLSAPDAQALACWAVRADELNFPLYWAAIKGFLDCFHVLLSFGADVSQANRKGNTPIVMSALYGRLPLVQALMAIPAVDINLGNKDGWTPLMLASERGHVETVAALCRHPSQPLQANKYRNGGNTALCQAAGAGWVEVVRLHLSIPNIDPNQANAALMTPLHLAAEKGHVEIVRLLLGVPGIAAHERNKHGKRPADLAHERGFVGLYEMLRSAP